VEKSANRSKRKDYSENVINLIVIDLPTVINIRSNVYITSLLSSFASFNVLLMCLNPTCYVTYILLLDIS